MSKKPNITTLSELGENHLVQRIKQLVTAHEVKMSSGHASLPVPRWVRQERPGLLEGIGDDTAVLQSPASTGKAAQNRTAWTTDMLVEGTHFLPDASPYAVGWKSAMVSLSDLASVGAWPTAMLISLGLPASTDVVWIDTFYKGLLDAIGPYGCLCVGGDCVRGPQRTINVAASGICDSRQSLPVRRKARAGQSIYVTGNLGDSGSGLELIQKKKRMSATDRKDAEQLIMRHEKPQARILAGLAIARLCPDVAMMDLSDGLAVDLPRLVSAADQASGATIRLAALPLSPALRRLEFRLTHEAEHYALFGGEDYELLFTTAVPESRWKNKVAQAGGGRALRISRIGKLDANGKVSYLDRHGKEIPQTKSSFSHFF